jgi:predicted dehydrogenase
MADRELKVGFIGAGRIADLHALAYEPNSRARIYAICTEDPEQNAARARQWGAEKTYVDYQDLLADPDVDAVEILLPHYLHEEVAVAAARAGKAISLEKPMARSVAEAAHIVAVAEQTGVDLRVFENFRHYPPIVLAKQLIEDGAIGEPQTQHISVIDGSGPGWDVPPSSWRWRFQPELCGGGPCVFDHGYHIFSIARFFLGPVEEVFAWILHTRMRYGDVDRPSMVAWKHVRANCLGSWESVGSPKLLVPSKYYTNDERISIIGEEGIIWINHCSGQLLSDPPVTIYRDGRTTSYHSIDWDWGSSFRLGGEAWHKHLLDGTPCETTAREGLEIQRFVEAAHLSAATNAPARPDSIEPG